MYASPHPLDFDWRFDAPTIETLCALVGARKVLALGAPSVARRIEASGGRVLLVDRQPVQNVRKHLLADVPTLDVPEVGFDIDLCAVKVTPVGKPRVAQPPREPNIPAIGAYRQVTVGCDKPFLCIRARDNSR